MRFPSRTGGKTEYQMRVCGLHPKEEGKKAMSVQRCGTCQWCGASLAQGFEGNCYNSHWQSDVGDCSGAHPVNFGSGTTCSFYAAARHGKTLQKGKSKEMIVQCCTACIYIGAVETDRFYCKHYAAWFHDSPYSENACGKFKREDKKETGKMTKTQEAPAKVRRSHWVYTVQVPVVVETIHGKDHRQCDNDCEFIHIMGSRAISAECALFNEDLCVEVNRPNMQVKFACCRACKIRVQSLGDKSE